MRKKKEEGKQEKNGHEKNSDAAPQYSPRREGSEIEKKILENLVELQKVHTNLAERFEKLAEQIVNLLNLFEMAARSFAEHPANQVTEKDKEFLEKVDKLLEQNKTIAKGLMLMEERIRERMYGAPSSAHEVTEREEPLKDKYLPPALSRPLPRL